MPQRAKPLPAPDPELLITDLEQLKVASDALRLQIIDVMAADPGRGWTAKELAESLATSQTKLYHHLSLLEEHGFIRVAGTRLVSGIREKRYQVSALSFRVDRSLLSGAGGEARIAEVLDAIFEKARTEIVASIRAGLIDMAEEAPDRRGMTLSFSHARLSPASVRKLMRQVTKLAEIDDLEEADGAPYGLVVGFYPRALTEERKERKERKEPKERMDR
jgi:DNA-binding transcriptional ArsR family regulator